MCGYNSRHCRVGGVIALVEKVKMSSTELHQIVHEVKFTTQNTIVRVRTLQEETVKVCEGLILRAHQLLSELDKHLEHLETVIEAEEGDECKASTENK